MSGRQLFPWMRRAGAAGALLLAGAYALALALPLPERLGEPPSRVVAFADGTPSFVFLSPDDKYRMEVAADELAKIDPDYLDALLRFEDKRFYHHPGVDPIAVVRAATLNLRLGRVASGASTLTMQLVRLLEPRPRTLRSKMVEALRALQIEVHLGKDEILAAYLSYLPFGRNVEGLPAASWAYFGHGPHQLTPSEIAVLVAVPQRPTSRFPSPGNQQRLRDARDEIGAWLLEHGGLDRDTLEDREPEDPEPDTVLAALRAAAVPGRIRPLPRNAPHAAFWLAARTAREPGHRLVTTLDRGIQQLAEERLARAHGEMQLRGIHNGAAVVVDHRRSEVVALVGNFDFFDAHGGQITGFANPRSPGSALKPFIYALAIDRGLALPEHLVPDIPTHYTDYAPSNYDGRFTGLVTLEDALSHSLNIPFVRLLRQVGLERFLGTLEAGGVSTLESSPGYYGLSAAIGSVEISPLELASLYATLAADGFYRPLTWRRTEPPEVRTSRGLPLFARGSAHLTRRALARRDRPDFPSRRQLSGAPPSIHWKTGTSYGHRDAWAAGSGPRYTVVVWLGNFDNRPAVDLVGAEAAGPLLFDLLEAVADRARPSLAESPSADLHRVEVCAYSGHLPTPACEQREWALALRHKVPTERCPYHVRMEVDLDTGLALNPSCRAGRRRETRTYLTFPAAVRSWLTLGHRRLPSPPSLAADCQAAGQRRAPSILSPPAGQTLVLLPGLPTSRQEVPLQAESTTPGTRLSWFVDGVFLGTAPADERLWWEPVPGRHEILVLDEGGLSSRRVFEVRSRSG